MQLVAYGSQDIYLTGNPQITFFKVVYRRHTNFSLESIEQTFNGTVDFGRRVTCTVSRNGDLIHKMYLQVKLPSVSIPAVDAAANKTANDQARWVAGVGHKLIKFVEVEIGGQRVDKHYGEWLHIWNELTQTAGHAIGYNTMIGSHPSFAVDDTTGLVDSQTLYIPLQFWFNRNPGLALPLIALQYHEVKINFEFAEFSELWAPGNAVTSGSSTPPSAPGMSASLYVDYVYLDTDERRRFAQVTHEYLIDQVQHTGAESIPGSQTNHKCKLNFNHPCKELVWVVRDNGSAASDPFDWSISGTSQSGQVSAPPAGGNNAALVDVSYGKSNPTKSALLQLNGHDRFSRRDGMYFNVVQPYQHHTNIPPVGINVYSFALKPEEHQPSGSCNMSRIDNATLILELESMNQGSSVSVFATNYNVLRIMSGMGGLAYAS